MKWSALLVAVACSSTVQKASQLDVAIQSQKTENKATDINTNEQKTQAASETETQKYDALVEVADDQGAITIARVTSAHPLKLGKGSKIVTTLPMVTSDSHVFEGAKTDDKQAETKSAKVEQTNTAKVKKLNKTEADTSSFGPGLKFYLWAALVIVILLAAGYVYLKFIRKAIPL